MQEGEQLILRSKNEQRKKEIPSRLFQADNNRFGNDFLLLNLYKM